jgi:hypothetical protein
MRLTAEIDRRTSGKVGGGRCYGPRLTNVLQAIQQFAAGMSQATQLDSLSVGYTIRLWRS